MKNLLPKLLPVISEVNERHALTERVELETVVCALQRHSTISRILRVPGDALSKGNLDAAYIGFTDRTAVILHPPYNEEDPLSDRNYPKIRFNMAKEMVHVFDTEEEKTGRSDVVVDLLKHLVARDLLLPPAHPFTAATYCDHRAIFGAVELLIRYEQRVHLEETTSLPEEARYSGDYTPLADMFLVSNFAAAVAFNQNYNRVIETLRGRDAQAKAPT